MELKNGEGFDVNKVKDMAEVCLCWIHVLSSQFDL